jgi:16S rRNA (guanine527-N7)-methyltransferase
MEKFRQDVVTVAGLNLTAQQISAFARYEKDLLDWNSRFNLTAIREKEGIRTKHFLDSLSCLVAMEGRSFSRLIDIGTGAGFPGIPLKIALPHLQLTLVESVGKKVGFCQHVVQALNLDKTEVLQVRAEELAQDPNYREKFDWAVGRAVANMSTLLEYLLPFVRLGGAILAQKGTSGPVETQSSQNAAQLLGGRLRILHKLELPGVVEERYLVVFDKVARTPLHYPRRIGIPSKTPLT